MCASGTEDCTDGAGGVVVWSLSFFLSEVLGREVRVFFNGLGPGGTLGTFALDTTTTWWAAIGVVEQGGPLERGRGGIMRLLSRGFGVCLF